MRPEYLQGRQADEQGLVFTFFSLISLSFEAIY